MTTPRASSTSALPHRDDAARLPCLATGHPAPAATSAAAVEMLKVPAPSPPVPHVSTASTDNGTKVACARIDSTMPVSSSTVSPLVRKAAINAPTWAGVASPSIIVSITARAEAASSPRPETTTSSARRMTSSPIAGDGSTGPHDDDPYTRDMTARTLQPFDPTVVQPWTLGDGPRGALLIHGFAGTPPELRRLGEMLAEHGFRCHAPVLPGHGTTPQELERTRWQDWAKCVSDAFDELAAECSDVVVAGQSMGGTLALNLAARDLRVSAVASLASPIWLSGPIPPLLPIIKR